MKSVWYGLLVFDRPLRWSLLGILIVRIIQFIYVPQSYFIDSGSVIAGFADITSVNWAMYTFIPLAIWCMSGLVDIPNEPYPVTRTRDKEDIVLRCLMLIVLKAAVFTAVMLLSGLALSALRVPPGSPELLSLLALVHFLIAGTLYIAVCGIVLLGANVLTGSLALSIACVLLYSSWDYIIAHTILLANRDFWWGWNLLMPSAEGELSVLLFGSLRLLMLAVLITCVLLFCLRKRDVIHVKRETK